MKRFFPGLLYLYKGYSLLIFLTVFICFNSVVLPCLGATHCKDFFRDQEILSELQNLDLIENSRIEDAYQEIDPMKLEAVSALIGKDRLDTAWRNLSLTETSSEIERNLKIYHAKSVVFSGVYFALSNAGHYVTAILRDTGVHNWLTLHFSNTFVGIGFIGLMDHLINIYNPRLRTPALISTAVVFTFYNAGFELGPAIKDWGDFIGGQIGLSLYLIVNSYVEFKLKTEKEGVPKDLPFSRRMKKILFPLQSPSKP